MVTLILLSAGAISACGGGEDSPAGEYSGIESTQSEQSANGNTGSQPESAGDPRPEAPDDVISDRPGGSGDNQKDGGQNISGDAGNKSDAAPSVSR